MECPCREKKKRKAVVRSSLVFLLFVYFFFSLSFVIRLTCDKDRKKRLESVICLVIRDLFFFFLEFCDSFNM